MKKLLQGIYDTLITLTEWMPLFDRDYRYSMNIKAYVAISCAIGGIMIALGIGIFLIAGLPYISWRETSVVSKTQTDSRCLAGGENNDDTYTYKYSYAVDDTIYETDKGYCDKANGKTTLLYDPSSPSRAVPIGSFGGVSTGFLVAAIGVIFIVFGFIVAVVLHYILKWIGR